MTSAIVKLIATLFTSAFLLNFVWEMWQVPFYLGLREANHWQAIRLCTLATAGDAYIVLLAYGLGAAVSRDGFWLFRRTVRGWAGFLGAGIVSTVALELIETGILDRWQYSESMPRIPLLDVGLMPILQWLILPPLTLWISSVFMRGWQESR